MVMMERSPSEVAFWLAASRAKKGDIEILRNDVASQGFQVKRHRVDDAVGLTIFLLFQMMQCN